MKNTQEGFALLQSVCLCTEVEGRGEGPIMSSVPSPLWVPPPMENGGTEGRAG